MRRCVLVLPGGPAGSVHVRGDGHPAIGYPANRSTDRNRLASPLRQSLPGTPGEDGDADANADGLGHSSRLRKPPPGCGDLGLLVKGWPTVSQSGVTMTGRDLDTQPAWGGWPAPGPEVTLVVTVAGLKPGESVSLAGTGSYDFEILGCGVEPTPCSAGSGTTDPTVRLCKPTYAQAAQGKARTAAEATAGADGTAEATLRFVIPESERACPAGASLPWYVQSGEWKLRVTDKAHGLRLVGPPDYIIGP
jgi:hypothetical protein